MITNTLSKTLVLVCVFVCQSLSLVTQTRINAALRLEMVACEW